MTQSRGSKDGGRSRRSPPADEEPDERPALISDLFRRAFTLGLTGIFTTEEAFRRALGDTVPQDWVDFAVDQSDRTRAEFSGRMAEEMARVLESMDPAEVLGQLLENHTIEVKAEFRLVPADESKKGSRSGRRSGAESQRDTTAPVARGGGRK